MIRISNVSKTFNGHDVLNNIDLIVNENVILGLAGPSGSGKSTLLRLMFGLDKPDSGQIVCKAKKGFVFQDFQLFPHMTVIENLTYAANIKFKRRNNLNYAHDLLNKLGLQTKHNLYPNKLSGGQKQRVALARSLMMNPEVLFCDEPTSSLDIATINDVVLLLKSIIEMKVTMIIASHDLDFLTKIATQIIVLKNGSIVANLNNDRNLIDEIKQFY